MPLSKDAERLGFRRHGCSSAASARAVAADPPKIDTCLAMCQPAVSALRRLCDPEVDLADLRAVGLQVPALPGVAVDQTLPSQIRWLQVPAEAPPVLVVDGHDVGR